MANNVVSDFKEKVEWLHEVEYGDFKRKLSLYIHRLEHSLPQNDQINNLIYKMKEEVIYNPDADIDLARMKVIEIANKLDAIA